MVHWTRLLSLIASACLAAAADLTEQTVPGAFIVELADNEDSNSFYNNLGSSDVAVKHRMKLDYELFKGTSFQLKNVSDVDAAAKKIANMDMVKQIWPVRVFSVPKVDVVWKGSDKNMAEAALRKRQAANATDTFSPHVMTQVDKLRADGVTGKGIKIAVIDTGIDYNHPALGNGCFGPGCLVSYGTDLVGDNYSGFNTPVPDKDPMDNCEGHGSHVAGIIAAQNNVFGFTGAAPDVTLGAYRVFGCSGSAGNDVLIAAYNQAYEAGSDIITASIGGPSGWTEDPWAVVVQRIVEAGVPCTVSAGNEGEEGIFYASTAANGKGVTAIASVDNSESPMVMLNASYTTGNASARPFGWTEGSPNAWGNISLPLWAPESSNALACDRFPANTPNLSERIVLIKRGTCTFVQKATVAAEFGAKYIMYYNNVAGLISVSAEVEGIAGAGMVTADQGAEWSKLLASGASITLDITDPVSSPKYVTSEANTETGGYMSTYTTWGPTWEVDVKPQLAAPGGLILSTYPLALGGYAVISGTSMACPLVAAVYALLMNVRGKSDPATLESVLSATSNPNVFHDGISAYPYLAPVAQQGSGLIQAYDAAHTKTLLSVSSLSFNDTDHFVQSTNFSIRNLGTEEVTYALSHIGAATAYTLNSSSIFPAPFPNEIPPQGASLSLNSDKITVPAGGAAMVTVSANPPQGLDAARLPVYSGYIALNGTNGESLSLPYLGVVGSLRSATVLDKNGTYLTKSTDNDLNRLPANQTFILPEGNGTAPNGTAFPAFVVNLALGSPLIRADVVPQDPSANATTVLGVRTLGSIFGYPRAYVPRGGNVAIWNGPLEDGRKVPAGTYTVLIRTLKIFGDPTRKEDYEAAETVPFTIGYR